MLNLYRVTLQARRGTEALRSGDFGWLDGFTPETLAFRRGDDFVCLLNTGTAPILLPAGDIVVASGPLLDDLLPRDTAVWLRTAPQPGEATKQGTDGAALHQAPARS